MNNPFEKPDFEYDRRCIKDYFFKEFLPKNFIYRGEDEEAEREVMFDQLSELVQIVEVVKKNPRKR